MVGEGSDSGDVVTKREVGVIGDSLTEKERRTKVETREFELLDLWDEEFEVADDLEGLEVLSVLRDDLHHGLELVDRWLEEFRGVVDGRLKKERE